MGPRLQRIVAEAAKFLAVGGIATAVAFVAFNVLAHGAWTGLGLLGDYPLVAFVVANTIGMLVSYRGSRHWAFRHREVVGLAGGRVTYFLVNTASMALPLACLAFSRYVLDRSDAVSDNIAANVVGLALGTAVRFWAFRRFVFLHPVTAARRRELHQARPAARLAADPQGDRGMR
ncbi:MAG TPA: GtrA family protein [Marmoricola sp.]|nr:GtrA family protein [Marmoricola sp.]